MRFLRLVVVLLSLPFVATSLAIGGWLATGPSVDDRAVALRAAQQLHWHQDRDATVAALQSANPEFDLMWRLFAVLAACDRALAAPDEADAWLAFVDDVIDDTTRTLDERGQRHFLLPYADQGSWVQPEAGSLFVDGEIALMVAARRVVADTPHHRALGRHWTRRVEHDLQAAGEGWPESYPDEAWAFCLTNALLTLRLHDHVDGTDHRGEIRRWTQRLSSDGLDAETGLVGSDWRADGSPLDGTEGSSIWWVSTGLLLLDPTLADVQYDGAHHELVGGLPGMAWSREWPGDAHASDIDSGPVVPWFDASPAASGFALVAARAHRDEATQRRMERALRAADLLLLADPRLADMDEAPMGDAIVLLGLGFGPLWDRVEKAG